MEEQIVDVDDDVGEAGDDGLHESLETGRRPKKSHWSGDPLKLPEAGNGEGSVGPGLGLQQHLPEAGGEVDG